MAADSRCLLSPTGTWNVLEGAGIYGDKKVKEKKMEKEPILEHKSSDTIGLYNAAIEMRSSF